MAKVVAVDIWLIKPVQIFQGFWPELQALLKAAESHALMFFIKAIGPANKVAGCKRPSPLVIASIKDSLPGQIFSSGVVVDNRDRAFAANILIVICNVIFGICDIDFYLVRRRGMMVVNLFIIIDNLTSFISIACNVCYCNRQFYFLMGFT